LLVLICARGENRVPARSRLYIGQSPSAGVVLIVCARRAVLKRKPAHSVIERSFIYDSRDRWA
jgi:hypothetical protein